ncbi:CGP-CTERM sorting domain-containing protein [Thermococcus waiotapuensis]|uniref:CGP-CTERM sorting domain-containing protein n=1 Tax=Thermococcus waiotapuensis TaxID=90909 RepID=A0AAE4NSX8_9EURY|nr:CGP-CTERM sorting domain-containing protein [Thermococcus waiotapuensis]MDV3103274.1 CGP-CTERM sorting domain-containing protein [Thermococcus waiotapuensis]
MKRVSLVIFLFLVLSFSPIIGVSSAQDYTPIPIFFWPMEENFSMIPVMAPHCYPLYFGLQPVEIEDKTYALISATAYTGCSNVSSPAVKILGVQSFNMTFNGVDGTFKSIKVAYYTPEPYRIALDLKTTNMTITYRPYNSTYELVLVDISNITLGPQSSAVLKTSDPGVVGWPRELHLKFLVDKVTGEGYFLENSERKYLGLFPLFPAPYFSPESYVESILKRTREFISTVEANPWVVEEILNKAKVETDPLKVNEYFQGFAMNVTTNILTPRYSYLGNPAVVVFGYPKDSSNSITVVLDFVSWVRGPYGVATLTGGPMVVNRSVAREVLREYLENGNPDPLKDLILKNALKHTVNPGLAYEIGEGFAIVDFYIPPSTGGILTLPLPSGFNGSYILIKPFINGSEPFLHVNYDSSLYRPENISERWKTLGQCMPYLRSEILSKILNILNNVSTVETFNASSFETLYPFVEGKLRECGFNLAEGNLHTLTSSFNPGNGSLGRSPTETPKTNTKKGICGPAFLVVLSLFTLMVKRRG